jgi:hypothetical protein
MASGVGGGFGSGRVVGVVAGRGEGERGVWGEDAVGEGEVEEAVVVVFGVIAGGRIGDGVPGGGDGVRGGAEGASEALHGAVEPAEAEGDAGGEVGCEGLARESGVGGRDGERDAVGEAEAEVSGACGEAGPGLGVRDEAGCDGVEVDVGEGLEDGLGVSELDAGGLAGVPEGVRARDRGLAAADGAGAELVDAQREQGVEVADEAREVALRVVDHEVVVVGHHDGPEDVDGEARSGGGEGLVEDGHGLGVGPQQELAAEAAAGHEDAGSGDDRAWSHRRSLGDVVGGRFWPLSSLLADEAPRESVGVRAFFVTL